MATRSTASLFKSNRSNLWSGVARISVFAGFALISACSTVVDNGNLGKVSGASPSVGPDAAGLDPVAAAAFWGTRYDREPTDKDVAVAFSSALRKIGSHEEALKVISKAAQHNPESGDVLFEYGKALIEDNRAFEAVRHLEYAQLSMPDRWEILSAYGVALDQIGEHKAAREKYDLALGLNPNSISLMNNKGLSYALSGKLTSAYNILTQASGIRRANSKVRQNLALVSALKGDLDGAARLARSDLPPQVAENNIAYFQTLLSQPANWQDFAASEIDVPSFDEPSFAETSFDDTSFDEPVVDEVEPLFTAPVEPQSSIEEITPAPLEDVTPAPLVIEPLPLEEEEELEDLGAPLVLGPVTVPATASFEDADVEPVGDGENDE